jgi:hypothetical protein
MSSFARGSGAVHCRDVSAASNGDHGCRQNTVETEPKRVSAWRIASARMSARTPPCGKPQRSGGASLRIRCRRPRSAKSTSATAVWKINCRTEVRDSRREEGEFGLTGLHSPLLACSGPAGRRSTAARATDAPRPTTASGRGCVGSRRFRIRSTICEGWWPLAKRRPRTHRGTQKEETEIRDRNRCRTKSPRGVRQLTPTV